MGIDALNTDDTDFGEVGAAAAGAQAVSMLWTSQVASISISDPRALAAVGAGSALGVAAMNFLAGGTDKMNRNFDIQDAIVTGALTGGVLYFGGDMINSYVPAAQPFLPAIVGATGDYLAQQLPKVGFLKDIWKKKA
jgi:hypothetical protein